MNTFDNVMDLVCGAFGDLGRRAEDGTCTLELADVTVLFYTDNVGSEDVYCRAEVASLEGVVQPDRLCEAALAGNFFWSGTDGAVLSLDPETRTLFLTERIPADDLTDGESVEAFCDAFIRMVLAWRDRQATYLAPDAAGKEVL